MSTTDIVLYAIKPIVSNLGFEIWDVAFEKEGPNWFLRVYLDKKDSPVTIDDCENISKLLSDKLDEIDPIEQSYYLEVSSAGLGRKLTKKEHFDRFVNEQISLKFYKPINGKKEIFGILKGFNNSKIELDVNGKILVFPLSDCSYVKLDDDLDLFD